MTHCKNPKCKQPFIKKTKWQQYCKDNCRKADFKIRIKQRQRQPVRTQLEFDFLTR